MRGKLTSRKLPALPEAEPACLLWTDAGKRHGGVFEFHLVHRFCYESCHSADNIASLTHISIKYYILIIVLIKNYFFK